VDNGVTIFFHGHDHIFAKEELDGVVYQEVPHAANDDYGSGFASNLVDYAGAVRHNNSGHIRITVSPTAATVDYVRAYLPQDEGTNGRGFNRDVSYAYTVAPIGACDSALDCDDGDPCTTDSCVVPDGCVHAPVPVCVSPAARFETGTVTVGATPVAVELAQQYVSPVVVSSVRYRNNTLPVVTRVSSVTGGSFALRLQNPSGQAPQAETVDYLVMDEGAWDFDDLRCEAQRALSTRTDSDASWVAESRSYLRAYTSPVVLGQIMSENDARWSVFWSRGSSATNPPSASALYVGKHVGEDAVTTRANETLGIIVCESRRGRVGGVDFEVKLGADTVGGTADAPPYSYGFFPAFAAAPSVAVVSQSGMDGANGSWAELHGASALSASALALSVDEDQTSDTERNHTTEQVAYAVFAANVVYPNADACPADPSKTTPGVCGCGTPDTDSDSDGIPDCIDVNAPPVAVADSAQTESGGAVTIAVAQNDSDPDHNLVASTARPISMPSGGTATALGDGTIRYVAATGYAGTDAFTYEICDAQGACAMAAVTVLVTAPPDPGGAPLEFVTTTVSGTRSTVLFAQSYADPVVVCSSRYASNSLPVVVRVSNVLADRFDVRLQNPSNAAVSAEAVSCLVVERGPWTVDGVKLEAQKYLSTVTDRAALWTGQTQAYLQSYSQPVVLGQVMTENDAGFSAFWCRGNSRTNPPSPTALMTGKMVAEDTDTTRVNETVGFVVIEAGHGVLRGIEYEAALGADTILGVGDAPPYSYTFRTPFARSLAGAVVSMSAMDGTNGGWAQLHGSSALSATRMLLSIDEDQILDSERQHANEQVSYFAFSTP
jgi:uncharacterized low-complexity protein